jgi:hypothetical protein
MDPELYFTLNLPMNVRLQEGTILDIQTLLEMHLADETIEKECEQCKVKEQKHTLTKTIEALPQVLRVSLTRFRADYSKDGRFVRINETLDLSSVTKDSEATRQRTMGSVVAVVPHIGPSKFHGHYTADVLRRRQDNGQEVWWLFDDDVSKEQSFNDVIAREREPGNNTNAYLIHYRLGNKNEATAAESVDVTRNDAAERTLLPIANNTSTECSLGNECVTKQASGCHACHRSNCNRKIHNLCAQAHGLTDPDDERYMYCSRACFDQRQIW